MNRPEPIELENNLGPDAVTGEINRVPWMAYDVDEMDIYIAEKDAEIAELKADNERLKYEKRKMYKKRKMYTKMQHDTIVDALCREHRQQLRAERRALWLTRAERASDKARIFYFAETCGVKLNINGYSTKEKGCTRMCTARWWMITWLKVERKCRAKAEEYK